ncbi:MAG: IS1634 family transposase, partial [Acidimicrobiales bacterium]
EDETKVLCLSEARAAKEEAITEAKQERFEIAFDKIRARIKAGQLKDERKVAAQLGKLSSKYPSIFRHYEIIWHFEDEAVRKKVSSIECSRKDSLNQKKSLFGCYVITTNHLDLQAAEIWQMYMTLTRVEAAFKALKSDLGLRPIFHQSATRTTAHLFISVLAYHLLAAIEESLRRVGDNRKWSTIRKILSTQQRTTIVLTDDKDQIHHIRVSSTPEAEHRKIYEALSIKTRLRRSHSIVGSM